MSVKFEGSDVLLVTSARGSGLVVEDIEIGKVFDKISTATIRDAILEIASVGGDAIASQTTSTVPIKEIELEFGLEVGTSGSLLVVKGDVKAHINVKLVWK